ncbi:MAG: extracellular solute-binding protein [Chloroflexota bacterium]|nr:extracellular solute-binding protein [Chloroflexota bacterium]
MDLTRRKLMGFAAILPPLVAACSTEAVRTGGDAPRSAEPVTVTFMSRTAEEEAFTRRTAQFQERYPNIKLDYQALAGDYIDVARTQAAAGTLADAVYMQNLLFEGLAAGDSIAPIDKLIQRDRLDLKQWYAKGIDALKLDGKLYGLPGRGQIAYCFLFFNRDAFQAAGMKEPHDTWTLDDLVSAADKLTARDGSRFGYGTEWGGFQRTAAALRRFGGDVLSPDGKKALVDTPEALRSIQWHWDLWHRRQVMHPGTASNNDFGQGQIAMAGQKLAGARGGIRDAAKDSFRFSLALMPPGPTGKHGAILSVAPVGLNSRAGAPDQAWEVVKWFTNKDTGIELGLQTRGSNTPGMRRDVYCDERLLDDSKYPREMLERICKAMDLASSITYSVPYNYRQPELDKIITRHVTAFRENTAAPSAGALKAMADEMQGLLDQPR